MNGSKVAGSMMVVLAFGVPMLTGCGGGGTPVAVKKADAEIADAKRALESGQNWERKSEWDMAIADYKRCISSAKAGKAFAKGPDLRTLSSLESEANDRLASAETQKMVKPKPPEKKVDTTQVAAVDPETAKKKAEEEKKKKEAEEDAKRKAEMAAKLNIGDGPAPKKKTEDEEAPATAAKKPDGGEAAPGDGDAAQPAAAPPKKVGPFPDVNDNSPPLNIVKITSNGKYVFCYIQLYNKDQNGKKIMGVTVFFKDKDNAQIIPENSVITVPFEGFSEKAKDPTAGGVNALTLGSHSIDGLSAMQLVAVGEHDRAKDCKKAGVRVVFDDGTKFSDTGPSAPAAPDEAPEGPGKLRLK